MFEFCLLVIKKLGSAPNIRAVGSPETQVYFVWPKQTKHIHYVVTMILERFTGII